MDLKYTLNQRPPMAHLLMYGLQWLILSIPNVLTVAMLAKIQFYDDVAMQTLYLQKLYAVLGLTMLAQALWGHRLPLVVGPAAVLIVGILSAQGAGFNAVYTGIAMGGMVLFLLSVSGLMKKIQRIFTPRIIITILGLIAMTLAPVFLGLVFKSGNPLYNFGFATLVVLTAFIVNYLLKGIWKSTTVILVTVAGTFVYYLSNPLPNMPDGVGNAAFSRLFASPEFDAGVVISFLICFFALLINELGSIQSVKDMVAADCPDKRITRGCAVTGLGNAFAGMLGVIGPVDFSVSPGLIASTGCASRYTIFPCAIGLILCSFSSSLVAVFTMLPDIVIGVVLMYIVVLQLAASFNMMVEQLAVKTFEHALTIAIPLGIGLFVSLIPEPAVAAMPAFLRPILSNGFVVGVLIVVFLEHLVFSKPR